MISNLFEAGIVLICKVCKFQGELGKLENPHSEFNLCPECMKSNKGSVLIKLEDYQKQEVERKLSRHIYCRDCGFIGLVADFPFNGPKEEPDSEKYCPKCMSVDGPINASSVVLCHQCRQKPAMENDPWCKRCLGQYDADCNKDDCEPL